MIGLLTASQCLRKFWPLSEAHEYTPRNIPDILRPLMKRRGIIMSLVGLGALLLTRRQSFKFIEHEYATTAAESHGNIITEATPGMSEEVSLYVKQNRKKHYDSFIYIFNCLLLLDVGQIKEFTTQGIARRTDTKADD